MRNNSLSTIGREAERQLLHDVLTGLHRKAGHAVFLVGEAGIGKSRLASDCAEQAESLGLPMLRGRGSPTSAGMPYRPLIEALNSRFRVTSIPDDPELEPYRPALSRVIPEWRHAAVPGYPESAVELAEAVLRMLAVLGRIDGCLLVLEDLHEADLETIAVVDYLVDNLAGLPILLVATLRPEPGAALELARGAERRRVASMSVLEPLDAPQIGALAAGCLELRVEQVPQAVVERLSTHSNGNPYLVEELLAEMVGSGALRQDAGGWHVVGDLTATVPASVVGGLRHRLQQLDPQLRDLLLLAATLGTRFSLGTLTLITGRGTRELLGELAAASGFVVPDATAVDQYAFRHALTGEALLAGLSPAERAVTALRAADAILAADPALSDGRCQLVARLRASGGDEAGATLAYAEAGRRALAGGASATAVQLLERAHQLGAPADRTFVTESLVYALAEAGQLDRAFALAESLPEAGAGALDIERRVALHTRLAWAAVISEYAADTLVQITAARAQLGGSGDPGQTAALAVVEGHLALLPGHGGPRAETERLAREAAEVAEREKLPVVACQAWQLLALLARERGFDHADACLERMLAVAEEHALPVWRVEALLRLGGNAFLRSGDARRIREARDAARDLGALALAQNAEGLLAMDAVQRADFATAREIIERCLEPSARMHNLGSHRYLLLVAATLAAHQGRRRQMERELLRFEQADDSASSLTPVLFGLCRTFCALLEENRAQALAELATVTAWVDRHPSMFYLSGQHGLGPLLAVLAGTADRRAYEAVLAGSAAALAWNRQFLVLADAILLGREGQGRRASSLVDRAQQEFRGFPIARHLGLRLVAEAAIADGWGDPVAWLRTAEEYFHEAGVRSVAGACRSLIRQTGVSVAQRRQGWELIPEGLRAVGVTPREHDVFALLVERLGNQDIAQRLSISPRTVEKHIASLLHKTGSVDRAELCRLARALCGD
ncbi:AAA family ATPase [Streptacidiphilus sp. P02-A3a]|uniref:helix-turn-helix transcriptional regulator n=1 Tax=Streptacidiphilus sp. P02-A3a TaxID=2704468 RepID=UPI0015FBC235|nr:AAA family ATPase [Streptacidiphilus sp. P02-A3a]QMU71800.1 AAA family ATPase [Streptacidiphilus sp. P02-A3a]